MEAEQVVQKILDDAKAKAAEIAAEEQKVLQAEKGQFDAESKSYDEQTKLLAKQAAEDTELQILASARMDVANELLAQKRQLLDNVFAEAAEQITKLPDAEYLSLMQKLMTQAVRSGNEEVVVSKDEKRIDTAFIKKVNENLKLSNEKGDFKAGFVLKEDKIKINVSIDVLLAQARQELEIELAKELFSD